MARNSMDLTSFVGKLLKEDHNDILREGIQALAQMIMDVEVSSRIGAAPYERSETRTAYRNGYRTRAWDTRVATVELKTPKLTPATSSGPPCSFEYGNGASRGYGGQLID